MSKHQIGDWALPPKKRNWKPGTYQLGFFIRYPDESGAETCTVIVDDAHPIIAQAAAVLLIQSGAVSARGASTTSALARTVRMIDVLRDALPKANEDEAAAWRRMVEKHRKVLDERDRLLELIRMHRRANWEVPGGTIGEVHDEHDAELYRCALGDGDGT